MGLDAPLGGSAEDDVDLSDFDLQPCKLDFGATGEAARAADLKHPEADLAKVEIGSTSPKTLKDDDDGDDVSCAGSHHTVHYEGDQEPSKEGGARSSRCTSSF